MSGPFFKNNPLQQKKIVIFFDISFDFSRQRPKFGIFVRFFTDFASILVKKTTQKARIRTDMFDSSTPRFAYKVLTPRLTHSHQTCLPRGRAVAPALPAQSARPPGQGVLSVALHTLPHRKGLPFLFPSLTGLRASRRGCLESHFIRSKTR